MIYKYFSTVTGTDLTFWVSHALIFSHLSSPKSQKPRIVWNFRQESKRKKSTDYSGFITVYHKASFICSRKLWLSIKKTFSLYLTGKIRMNRLPRVKGYWCCLLKLIQTAHLQPYRHRSTVSIPEYTPAFIYKFFLNIHLYFFQYGHVHTYIYVHKRNKSEI